MLEEILTDIYKADSEWNVVLLRYFNPIGAHESGDLGENPNGIPNNLLPYVTQVAVGKLEQVQVLETITIRKTELVFVTISTLSTWQKVTLQL